MIIVIIIIIIIITIITSSHHHIITTTTTIIIIIITLSPILVKNSEWRVTHHRHLTPAQEPMSNLERFEGGDAVVHGGPDDVLKDGVIRVLQRRLHVPGVRVLLFRGGSAA
jgi:hypothetical protein